VGRCAGHRQGRQEARTARVTESKRGGGRSSRRLVFICPERDTCGVRRGTGNP
jgi:hypothetical protein